MGLLFTVYLASKLIIFAKKPFFFGGQKKYFEATWGAMYPTHHKAL
jgi:hypothetical protein